MTKLAHKPNQTRNPSALFKLFPSKLPTRSTYNLINFTARRTDNLKLQVQSVFSLARLEEPESIFALQSQFIRNFKIAPQIKLWREAEDSYRQRVEKLLASLSIASSSWLSRARLCSAQRKKKAAPLDLIGFERNFCAFARRSYA